MPHLVVARHHEPLAWLHDLPAHCTVTVYNAGEAIDSAAFDAQVTVLPVAPGTPAIASFLHHLQQGPRAWRGDMTVFTPGDPLALSPAFFELLAHHDRFGDLQVMSSRSAGLHCGGQADRRDWHEALEVRAERYSLATLAPLSCQQDTLVRTGSAYRRKHGLPEGTPLLAHFFSLVGLEKFADAAAQADIGLWAHGGMVAVRTARLAQTLSQCAAQLHTMGLLVRADRNYPEVAERAWLHLLGQPFVRLDALAAPVTQPLQTAAPSMARVVASIDAVLAQSAPRLSAVPRAPAPLVADVALLRQRAQAAFLRGEHSSAWDLLHQALDQAPQDIGLLADATQMAYAQQDTTRALQCARRALAIDPDHQDCLFTLGMCLAANGEAEEALALFERLHQAGAIPHGTDHDAARPAAIEPRRTVAA